MSDSPEIIDVPESVDTFTKKFFLCPRCRRHEWSVSHLEPGRSAGPWSCESCGLTMKFIRVDEDGRVSVVRAREEATRPLHLLRLRKDLGEVYVVVTGYGSTENPPTQESATYLYEEHHCPTNITSSITEVFVGPDRDADCHGMFQYIGLLAETSRPDNDRRDSELAHDVAALLSVTQDDE